MRTMATRREYVMTGKKESILQEMFKINALLEGNVPYLESQRETLEIELFGLRKNLTKSSVQRNIILTKNIDSLTKEIELLNHIICTSYEILKDISDLKPHILTKRE